MSPWGEVCSRVEHRPWPLPRRRWAMTMTWSDLLFAHWRVEPDLVRRAVPRGLELDLYAGQAYVGVVPFRMENVGPRGLGGLPARLPGPRSFAELNVRTYVRCPRQDRPGQDRPGQDRPGQDRPGQDRPGQDRPGQDRPGVWFFSLDATSRLAIEAARISFHLPYVRADITIEHDREWIVYRCRRRDRRMGMGSFDARYRSVGEQLSVLPDSLEHWLTERYCLYSSDRAGGIWRGEIHHRPWPLRQGEAEIDVNSIADAHDIDLAKSGEPLFHVAQTIDVVGWLPVPVLRG